MFNKIDVYEGIQYDDLNQDLQLLADIIGIDAVRKLIKESKGLTFYIPKIKHFHGYILRYMKFNPDFTIKQIATFFEVSEMFIRKLKFHK